MTITGEIDDDLIRRASHSRRRARRGVITVRLRTDFWIGALLRRVEAAGAPMSQWHVGGAAEAGAIFVTVDGKDGSYDLYGPAPQTSFTEDAKRRPAFSADAPGRDG
jgi:hypothetical protein